MSAICPKCGHRSGAGDDIYPGVCPACGIARNKWRARLQPAAAGTATGAAAAARSPIESTPPAREGQLAALLMHTPGQVEPLSWYARAALWLGLLLWGGWFAVHGIDWAVINGSFMHQINLPFHEFGHVLFMPLGRFMGILGGSLFQLLLPLGLAVAFVVRQRDGFGASVCLWWCGQSLVDLAPYIADAPIRALPLVGGAGEASHDWGNLLTMLGWLHGAQSLARGSFVLGCGLMAAALWWGIALLRRQRRRMATAATP